ncbi:Hypothetical protein FKW44_006186, partial [Caligus rogercresseyi]
DPQTHKYWNNALICWFKLYASIHSHWDVSRPPEYSIADNTDLGKFSVIFGHFWVILCPEGLQTPQN